MKIHYGATETLSNLEINQFVFGTCDKESCEYFLEIFDKEQSGFSLAIHSAVLEMTEYFRLNNS